MKNLLSYLEIELKRSMKLAAEREEFQSAGDFQRMLNKIQGGYQKVFYYQEVEELKSKIERVMKNYEIQEIFDKFLEGAHDDVNCV